MKLIQIRLKTVSKVMLCAFKIYNVCNPPQKTSEIRRQKLGTNTR